MFGGGIHMKTWGDCSSLPGVLRYVTNLHRAWRAFRFGPRINFGGGLCAGVMEFGLTLREFDAAT